MDQRDPRWPHGAAGAATRRIVGIVAVALLVVGLAGACAKGQSSPTTGGAVKAAAAKKAATYQPQTRSIDMVTAPLVIGEDSTIPQLDFLKPAFKKGGLLDGHEVFMFDPNMLSVCKGDTVSLTIANPGPDDHVFFLPDFNVNQPIPVGKKTSVSFVASKAGVYRYYCTVAEHMPYMQGFLTVYDDSTCG